MSYTDGRFVIADTDAAGARDPIALTSQVKTMRGMIDPPGLILIVVDDRERDEAVRRISDALTGDAEPARPVPLSESRNEEDR